MMSRSGVAIVAAALFFSFGAPALAAEPQAAEDVAALAADDECRGSESEQCSLNALQLKGHRAEDEADEPLPTEEEQVLAAMAGFNDSDLYNDFNDNGELHGASEHHHHHHDHSGGNIVTGWHQTSVHAGHAILRSGFRSGHVGYCGGGIYFASSPGATGAKAIGPDSHHGFIIEAKINLGRVKHMGRTCFSRYLGVRWLSHTPTAHFLNKMHADSFVFNPIDGTEYVIADPSRVVSMKQYHHHHHR